MPEKPSLCSVHEIRVEVEEYVQTEEDEKIKRIIAENDKLRIGRMSKVQFVVLSFFIVSFPFVWFAIVESSIYSRFT